MSTQRNLHRQCIFGWWFGAVFIICFWTLLLIRGFPAPHVDDIYYVGAAINLFHGFGFVNPFCDSFHKWPFSEGYYCYMPGQSYLLAGWLKTFGLSSLSMRMFPTACAAGTSLFVYRFFRASPYSIVPAIGIVICLLVFLGGTGLRPDGLGLMLFARGLGVFQTKSRAFFFLCNLSLAFGMVSYANVIYLGSFVTVSSIVYHCLEHREEKGLLFRLGMSAAAAYLIALVLFLCSIHFHLADFCAGLKYARDQGVKVVRADFNLNNGYEYVKWFAFQLSFLVFLFLVYWPKRFDRTYLFLVILVGAGYISLAWVCTSSISGSHLWATGCLLAALYLIWNGYYPAGRTAMIVWFFFCVIFVVAHGHTALMDLLCEHRTNSAQNQAILARLNAEKPERVYMDSYAMRELYGYNIPPNVYDYCQCSLSGWLEPQTYADIPQDSVAVISVTFAFPGHGAELRRPLLGKLSRFFCANPYDLVLNDHRSSSAGRTSLNGGFGASGPP